MKVNLPAQMTGNEVSIPMIVVPSSGVGTIVLESRTKEGFEHLANGDSQYFAAIQLDIRSHDVGCRRVQYHDSQDDKIFFLGSVTRYDVVYRSLLV